MLRVQDIEKSINFYQDHLNMRVLRQNEFPDGRFSLTFLGYGDESEQTVLELTHNWDQDAPYDLGTGFGHLAIGVTDIYGLCEKLEAQGVPLPRKPGAMKHGTTVIAFIEDPDGYKIELIERN
jgi:lactoylglutathione lyase